MVRMLRRMRRPVAEQRGQRESDAGADFFNALIAHFRESSER
jgi:hypothetical protein